MQYHNTYLHDFLPFKYEGVGHSQGGQRKRFATDGERVTKCDKTRLMVEVLGSNQLVSGSCGRDCKGVFLVTNFLTDP